MSSENETGNRPFLPSGNLRRLFGLVPIAIPPVLAGVYQFYMKTHGSNPGQINFNEEFAKGSLPALMGGLAMLGLYTLLTRKEPIDHEVKTMEQSFAYGSGAILGYAIIAIARVLIH